MPVLIDTDVAIHWRDGNDDVRSRIMSLNGIPLISAITRVELENGVYRHPAETPARRARIDLMLKSLRILDFTEATAVVYSSIIAGSGYARARTNDRMIAATALEHDLSLITINGRDFRDIERLRLEVWDAPQIEGDR